MILESIVTTVDLEGQVNIAPMGPTVLSKGDPVSPAFKKDVDGFVLRPFKSSGDCLMTETNPEDWAVLGELMKQVDTATRISGTFGTRRENHRIRIHPQTGFYIYLIASQDFCFMT